MRPALLASVMLLGSALFAPDARADALDGDWCHSDGRKISVHGSTYVTPGGKRIEGEYQRHYGSFTIPAGEPGAGKLASLAQINEQRMRFRLGDGEAEIWTRCSAPGS